MLVTFEGIGGAGKTTQVEELRRRLVDMGRPVSCAREPGGTPLGESLRETLLAQGDIDPWTETLLFAAARSELVERVIRPALERSEVVLCDRYVDSSLVYQGVLRGLGIERVLQINELAIRGTWPDLTILLVVDIDEAGRRRQKLDRIETSERETRAAIDDAYRLVATKFPERIRAVDANRAMPIVAADIWNIVTSS